MLEMASLSKVMQEYIASGPHKVIEFQDGYYVVGLGDIIPVNNRQHGLDKIEELENIFEAPTDER